MFLVYNLLLTLLAPLWAPWMWLRTRARKEQPNWGERAGNYDLPPRKDGKRVWIHAVSVGEVVAATPILRELRSALPDHEIVLSVTTSSGHQTAREQAKELYDHLVYFPIDIARFQLSAMQRARPSVVAIMETELWMNFLWAAKVFDARTLLINGRISDRSFRRSLPLRFFYKSLLAQVDRCLMQTEKDATRIKALGAPSVEVFGNAKFDQALSSLVPSPVDWRKALAIPDGKPVVVVGSTRGEGEERFVIEALRKVGLDRIAVVHAPRHLERVPALSRSLESAGISQSLRSGGAPSGYTILDSYGELDEVYAIADLVIVGGGFENHGGQNLIQPLAHGKPVLHGPHMQNFREVATAAAEAGASQVCRTSEELAAAAKRLLDDPLERAKRGHAARALVSANAGAARRYALAIAEEAGRFEG